MERDQHQVDASGTQLIPRVYAVTAVVLWVVALVRAVVLRNQLAVPDDAMLWGGLYEHVWWDWARLQLVTLVALPALAAAADHLVPRAVGATTVAARPIAIAAPWCYVVGAVLVESSLQALGTGGAWFNYAPNSGAVFADPAVQRQALGELLVLVALSATALTLVATLLRHRRGWAGARTVGLVPTLLAGSQVIVAVLGPLLVARRGWELWVDPGLWG